MPASDGSPKLRDFARTLSHAGSAPLQARPFQRAPRKRHKRHSCTSIGLFTVLGSHVDGKAVGAGNDGAPIAPGRQNGTRIEAAREQDPHRLVRADEEDRRSVGGRLPLPEIASPRSA